MTDTPPQLYAKHLLPFGYGYPLWTPEPSHELLMLRQNGLQIGDVGVIDLENGSFDVFFNICLSREHPLHRVTGVPDNFVPIQLNEWDIATFPHAEYPGRVISTSSVAARSVESPEEVTSRNPVTYDFSFSSSEGALLILPKGAEGYKLRKRQIFKDIAIRNAFNWYDFAERHLGRIIAHDSLYLITGFYKTRSWSVAAFHQSTGSAESFAQFKASQVGSGGDMAYTWETMRALHWRVGPQIDVGNPNQSVFISGFKIAIREGMLRKKRVEVEADAPLTQLQSAKFSNGRNGPSPSRFGSFWRRSTSGGGNGGRKPAPQSGDAGATRHVALNHVPNLLQSFHLSDVVNRYLLSKDSSANVAITHDTQWGVLFEKGLLKSEDLDHDGRLEEILSENYRMVSRDGAVCLQPLGDSSVRPTDIDAAVLKAWNEDRLDDAEEILSGYLIRRMGSEHSLFGSRALIRARLRQWDAALRDAESSIDIQPSVVAHVAKGFALFGQGKYEYAVEAFNVAFQQCDDHDRDIVLLIKSIVLFEVGFHAESMASIVDQIERGPAEVKLACSSVQAEMYIRLATLAAKSKDYNRALQLLSRAQSLGPFRAVPDLSVISLICGWRFSNLQFAIHKQNCEVLYLVGRINEVLDLLQTMRHDLEGDAGTGTDGIDWITTFTRQCLSSLESLGDSAMASQNYTEAVTHYSMVLRMEMDPIRQEGILVKRSKGYAAARIWDNALKDANEAINLNSLSPWGYERKYEALQGMGRRSEADLALERMLPILERSTDPRTQHLRSRYSNAVQPTAAIQPSNSRRSALPNDPPRDISENSSNIELVATPPPGSHRAPDTIDTVQLEREEVVRAQNILTRHLEQQRGVQVAELTAKITTLREQLGSDVIAGDRDQLLRRQLTDVLNTMLQFPHMKALAVPGDGDQSPTTGSVSAHLHAHTRAPNIPDESVQDPNSRQVSSGPALVALSEHARDVHDERYSPTRSRRERVSLPTFAGVSSGERPRDNSVHEDHSEDTYPDELRDGHHPRQKSELVRRSTSGTLPRATTTSPRVMIPSIIMTGPGSGKSASGASDSVSDAESPVSPQERESKWGLLTPNSQPRSGPTPPAADVSLKKRKRTLRTQPSSRSGGQSETSGGPSEVPSWNLDPHKETTDPSTTAANIHVQQPGPWYQPANYGMMPSSSVPPYDTLLEILREERAAHRASVEQQQELTKQMWSLSEWLMREMQDRLIELRGAGARTYSSLPRPGEVGHPPFQYHQSTSNPISSSFGSMPWLTSSTPWYPPPPFNATPYAVPFAPSTLLRQQTPFIPPMTTGPTSGSPDIPQQHGGSKEDSEDTQVTFMPVPEMISPPEPVLKQAHAASSALNSPPPSRPGTFTGKVRIAPNPNRLH